MTKRGRAESLRRPAAASGKVRPKLSLRLGQLAFCHKCVKVTIRALTTFFQASLGHDKVSGFVACRRARLAGGSRFQGVHMALIYDLVKDRRVYSVEADSSVLEAARFMMEHNIGAVPVLRNGELAGIFSERDIMNRVVAIGRSPGTTRVAEVMTANPKAVSVTETVENSLFLMREHGFRHLPITEGKQLKGLVSLRDLL